MAPDNSGCFEMSRGATGLAQGSLIVLKNGIRIAGSKRKVCYKNLLDEDDF